MRTIATLALLASGLCAQALWLVDPFTFPTSNPGTPAVWGAYQYYLPSAAYPGQSQASPPLQQPTRYPNPAGIVGPGTGGISLGGDLTIDRSSEPNVFYISDGAYLTAAPHPNVGSDYTTPPPAGVALPVRITRIVPQIFATGGLVTAMTFDSTDTFGVNGGNPVLWICDGMNLAAFVPPPLGAGTAPTLIPGTTSVPGLQIIQPGALTPGGPLPPPTNQITGIDIDPVSGQMVYCDYTGVVYNFHPRTYVPGTLVTPGICPNCVSTVASVVPVGRLITAVAVNNTASPAAFPAPACSTQLPSGVARSCRIVVTDGVTLYDATAAPGTGIPVAPTGLTPSTTHEAGLAFCNDPQYRSPPLNTQPCANILTARPYIAPSTPITNGILPEPTVDLRVASGSCVIPTGAVLCIDYCFGVGAPAVPGLLLNAASLTFVAIPVAVGPNGDASYPLSGLSLAPAGLQFTAQWVYWNAIPNLFCTDAMTMTVGAP